MKDKNIEEKLNTAFKDACPDIFDDILKDCETQKGKVITMKTNKNKWLKPLISAAAVFAIVLSALGIYNVYSAKIEKSVVSLDVNPSIELSLNKNNKVLKATPLNEDAKKVLGDMDFKNTDLDVAVNAIIGSIYKNGYIDELANSVLISVNSDSKEHNEDLQAEVADLVNEYLDDEGIDGALISQSYSDDDMEDIAEFAAEHNISQGKAKYVLELHELLPIYDEDDLAKLSVNELNLLAKNAKAQSGSVNYTGNASDKAYIGERKALEIALSSLKLNENDIRDCEVELEIERIDKNIVMIYEVEFEKSNIEYEVHIDAKTGKILNSQKEIDEKDDDDIIPQGNYIPKEKAQNTALNHAKLNKKDVTELKSELEKEDGKVIYDVEFKYNNREYNYEIDAQSGKILNFKSEIDS